MPTVLGLGHYLKVVRVNALSVAALVVNHFPVRNLAEQHHPNPPMSKNALTVPLLFAVACALID